MKLVDWPPMTAVCFGERALVVQAEEQFRAAIPGWQSGLCLAV